MGWMSQCHSKSPYIHHRHQVLHGYWAQRFKIRWINNELQTFSRPWSLGHQGSCRALVTVPTPSVWHSHASALQMAWGDWCSEQIPQTSQEVLIFDITSLWGVYAFTLGMLLLRLGPRIVMYCYLKRWMAREWGEMKIEQIEDFTTRDASYLLLTKLYTGKTMT